MTTYKLPDGNEYPEYTAFARYQGGVMFVPLLISENRVRFYALCNLREVATPFDSGLLYDQPQPCRAIVLWRPVVTLTPDLLANVNHALYVEVRAA